MATELLGQVLIDLFRGGPQSLSASLGSAPCLVRAGLRAAALAPPFLGSSATWWPPQAALPLPSL